MTWPKFTKEALVGLSFLMVINHSLLWWRWWPWDSQKSEAGLEADPGAKSLYKNPVFVHVFSSSVWCKKSLKSIIHYLYLLFCAVFSFVEVYHQSTVGFYFLMKLLRSSYSSVAFVSSAHPVTPPHSPGVQSAASALISFSVSVARSFLLVFNAGVLCSVSSHVWLELFKPLDSSTCLPLAWP